MYYPYFRGKQYELLTVRENARLLSESGFVPIIEPVKQTKQSTKALENAVVAVKAAGGECVLIVNPSCGDYALDPASLADLARGHFVDYDRLSVGILLSSSMSTDDALRLFQQYREHDIALIHYGFENGGEFAHAIEGHDAPVRHIFVEGYCGRLYRKHFRNAPRILVRDGFQRRTNREHPQTELFSDLYLTFDEESMDGFGDFLVVGDDYSEAGGPAYAVAIHLTYIDAKRDGAMFIDHFVSDRTDTPTDPAGKFAEAVSKLASRVSEPKSPIMMSRAVGEFLALHMSHHFPGLGYVKKLSMQHHIETLAQYFAQAR